MERKENNICLLWDNAKELAANRGLHMDEKCPLDKTCKGNGCVVLSDIDKLEIDQKNPEYFKRHGEVFPRNDFMLKQLRLELKGMDSNE